jgi:DNA repair exonuclease SbcCD ATPase subunit
LERKKVSLASAVDHKVAERARLRTQLNEMEDPAESVVDEALVEKEKELMDKLHKNRRAQEATQAVLTNLHADERVARQQLARIDKDECPTCEQEIPVTMRKAASDAVDDVVQRNTEHRAIEQSLLNRLVEEESAIRKEGKETSDLLHAQQAESRASKQVSAMRTRVETQLDTLKAEVDQAFIDLESTEEQMENAIKDQAVLEACDQVLGLKGVRAHVLGKTLGGIEEVANSWLARIAGDGLELRLSPYKEKKAGGVSDAISLEVEGAGGGFGYRAASGGERRRIDVALLLALADVSAAAHGQSGGTLFFDEVFDSLDEEGIDATIEAIHDLSQERAVLVISHNENFAARLGPKKHVRL